jgi:hypothetical protein
MEKLDDTWRTLVEITRYRVARVNIWERRSAKNAWNNYPIKPYGKKSTIITELKKTGKKLIRAT